MRVQNASVICHCYRRGNVDEDEEDDEEGKDDEHNDTGGDDEKTGAYSLAPCEVCLCSPAATWSTDSWIVVWIVTSQRADVESCFQ